MGLESYRYGTLFEWSSGLYSAHVAEPKPCESCSPFSACNVKWLGVRGGDLHLIPEGAFQELKPRDLQIAKGLMSSKFLQVCVSGSQRRYIITIVPWCFIIWPCVKFGLRPLYMSANDLWWFSAVGESQSWAGADGGEGQACRHRSPLLPRVRFLGEVHREKDRAGRLHLTIGRWNVSMVARNNELHRL